MHKKILLVAVLGFTLFVSATPTVVHAIGEGDITCQWVTGVGQSVGQGTCTRIINCGAGFVPPSYNHCEGRTQGGCPGAPAQGCVSSGVPVPQGTVTCYWRTDAGGGCVQRNDCVGSATAPSIDSCTGVSQTECPDVPAQACIPAADTDFGGSEDPGSASSSSFQLDNPLKDTEIADLIKRVINFLQLAAGSILVVIILFGAFQIMTSSGNPENIKKGRSTIVWALIGFAIILIAGGLGALIANILGGEFQTLDPDATGIATTTDVIGVINTIARWMYGILMALGVVFILYSALLFLTSGGNQEKVSGARRALIYAIVALVIGVLAWGAESLIKNLLK